MWFSLLLLVLLFAIAIRQATQGFFAALIMAVLTICCAAAAFGTYEWVAIHWLAPNWRPDYALPIALGAIFGVPLVILRVVFDQLVRRACLLPALVDRIGGGVSGLVTAVTTVGVLDVCLQMIPFGGGEILGFAPFPAVAESEEAGGSKSEFPAREEERHGLLLSPDRLAVRLASVVSHGIFSTGRDFFEVTPDLVEVIGWVGATHPAVSRFAPPGSISFVGARPVQAVYKMKLGDQRSNEPTTYEPEAPASGNEFHMVRVKLQNKARDARKSHLFTLRQFRLVGRQRQDGPLKQYHPIAIQQEDATDVTNRHIRHTQRGHRVRTVVDQIYSPRDDNNNEVEIVFELPVRFEPTFLEYKREARVEVSFDKAGTFESPPPVTPPTAERTASTDASTSRPPGRLQRQRGPASEQAPRRRRGGRVRTVTTKEGASRFGDELPITLTSYRRLKNAEFSRGALVGGHLVGSVSDQAGGKNQAISKFVVPEDKRLLQLSSIRLDPRSAFGKVMSQAISTTQNYYVEDDRGRQYKVVGKYAIANVGGEQVVEVQYFSEPSGSIGGLGKFDRIAERKLAPSDTFALLFLVDPGARIVAFSTGGAASRRDDLSHENLVAPD